MCCFTTVLVESCHPSSKRYYHSLMQLFHIEVQLGEKLLSGRFAIRQLSFLLYNRYDMIVLSSYVVDETNPSAIESDWDVNYEILSKSIKQKQAKPAAATTAEAAKANS